MITKRESAVRQAIANHQLSIITGPRKSGKLEAVLRGLRTIAHQVIDYAPTQIKIDDDGYLEPVSKDDPINWDRIDYLVLNEYDFSTANQKIVKEYLKTHPTLRIVWVVSYDVCDRIIFLQDVDYCVLFYADTNFASFSELDNYISQHKTSHKQKTKHHLFLSNKNHRSDYLKRAIIPHMIWGNIYDPAMHDDELEDQLSLLYKISVYAVADELLGLLNYYQVDMILEYLAQYTGTAIDLADMADFLGFPQEILMDAIAALKYHYIIFEATERLEHSSRSGNESNRDRSMFFFWDTGMRSAALCIFEEVKSDLQDMFMNYTLAETMKEKFVQPRYDHLSFMDSQDNKTRLFCLKNCECSILFDISWEIKDTSGIDYLLLMPRTLSGFTPYRHTRNWHKNTDHDFDHHHGMYGFRTDAWRSYNNIISKYIPSYSLS